MVETKNRFDADWPLQDLAVQRQLEQAFQSGDWGRYHGPFGEQLSDKLSEMYQCDHIALTCSGTMGIELALRAAGITDGDEVVLAGYDFPGNFRCIEAVGAVPVLVDVGTATWTLRASDLQAAKSSRTKAVIVSSLHGGMPDMSAVMQWASAADITVIEDICQAPGALLGGQRLGTFGDLSVLSFGGSKLLTAGRGGAVVCQNAMAMQRLSVFKDRGNDAFPLSELQACVLLPQLEQLDSFHHHRRKSVDVILQATGSCNGITPVQIDELDSPAFYKLAWVLEDPQRRDAILNAAQQIGVPLFEGFRGFVKRSERRCRKPVPLNNSEAAAAGTLLLHHPVLLAEADVIEELAATLKQLFEMH